MRYTLAGNVGKDIFKLESFWKKIYWAGWEHNKVIRSSHVYLASNFSKWFNFVAGYHIIRMRNNIISNCYHTIYNIY